MLNKLGVFEPDFKALLKRSSYDDLKNMKSKYEAEIKNSKSTYRECLIMYLELINKEIKKRERKKKGKWYEFFKQHF